MARWRRRRAKAHTSEVEAKRRELIEEHQRPGEVILGQVPVVTPPTTFSLPFPIPGSDVILFATTERVAWAGWKGDYESQAFPDGALVRFVEYRHVKDFGAIGDLMGDGFSCLVVAEPDVGFLDSSSTGGMLTPGGLSEFALQSGTSPDEILDAASLLVEFESADLLQSFFFPVWGPWCDALVAAIREQIATHRGH